MTKMVITDVTGNVYDLSEFMSDDDTFDSKKGCLNIIHTKPPGVAGELVDHYTGTTPTGNRFPAFAAVLAAMAALTNNKYVVRFLKAKDTPLNLYVAVVLTTASGKESAFDAAAELTKIGGVQCVSDVASGQALHKAMARAQHKNGEPNVLITTDEFGKSLEEGRKNKNSWQGSYWRMLLQAYGKARSVLPARPAIGRESDLPEVEKPFVSTLFASTAQGVFQAMNAGDISDGTLNRILIIAGSNPTYATPDVVVSRDEAEQIKRGLPKNLAKIVKIVAQGIHRIPNKGEDDVDYLRRKDNPGVILVDKRVIPRALALHKKTSKRSDQETEAEMLGGRVFENTLRIAGVLTVMSAAERAVNAGKAYIVEDDLVISPEIYHYSEALTLALHQWQLDTLVGKIKRNERSELLDRVVTGIAHFADSPTGRQAGGWVPKRNVMQRLKGSGRSTKELNDAVQELKDTGELVEAVTKNPSTKRDVIIWRLTGVTEDDIVNT